MSVPRPWRLSPLLLLWLGLPVLAQPRPTLSLQPGTVKPGEPLLVRVSGVVSPTGTVGRRPLRFYPVEGGYQALTGLPVEQPLGPLGVKVSGLVSGVEAQPVELEGTLEVVDAGWPRRELSVSRRFIQPSRRDRQRMEEDRAAFASAFAQPFSAPLFQGNFAWPRLARITAPFGDLRLFNGRKRNQHFGTDIDGELGEVVRAANDGTVVMVRDNYSAGRTVLLYHGAGLYTAYFHLSQAQVKQGDAVKRGQLLGAVGRSGRVTGPHLHWGAKVDDMWVDAEALLRLDFL